MLRYFIAKINIKYEQFFLYQPYFINESILYNFKIIFFIKKMNYQVGGRQLQTDVYLNVYDLDPNSNQMFANLGLGFYHTGIHLGLNEYTFAGHNGTHTGVMEVTPKTNTPNFRQAIHLGKTTLSWREINKVLDDLREAFPGNSYHFIRKNCNSFSNALCQALLGKSIPGYVNRMANIGKFFLQIDDFVRMRPYDNKFQVSFKNQLKQKNLNVFGNNSKGVIIG